MDIALEWVKSNGTILGWFTLAGFASLVLFMALTPWVVGLLPSDYFARHPQQTNIFYLRHPAVRIIWHVIKNLLGVVFVAAGLIMLFTPGQGLLTILLGLICLDFPGKRLLERKMVERPTILRALNWMRRHRNKTEFYLN
jgi:hypothetical protein